MDRRSSVASSVASVRRASVGQTPIGQARALGGAGKGGGAKALGVTNDSSSFNTKTMMQAASKISTQVGSLYRISLGEAGAGAASAEPSKAVHFSGGGREENRHAQKPAEGVAEDDDRSSSGGGSSLGQGQDDHDRGLEVGDDEDFDYQTSVGRVNGLLESLRAETRTEIMDQLNGWYTARVATVESDREALVALEEEHTHREECVKDNMKGLLQSFDKKHNREVKVLVKCSDTLHRGANNQLKRRRRFAKGAGQQDPQPDARESVAPEIEAASEGVEATPRVAGADSPELARKKTTKTFVKAARLVALAKTSASKTPAFAAANGEQDVWNGIAEGQGSHRQAASELGAECPLAEGGGSESANEDAGNAPCIGDGDADGEAAEDEAVLREVFDLDVARRVLKEMHDAPQRLWGNASGEETSAATILKNLSVVQEGQNHLEHQAFLARKNVETLQAAVDHVAEGGAEPATPAVNRLIHQVKVQVFGEQGDGGQLVVGPDPEELEAECQVLEQQLAQQEAAIEKLKKQRERSHRMAVAMQTMRKESKDDSEDESEQQQPVMQKSFMTDARLDAVIAQQPLLCVKKSRERNAAKTPAKALLPAADPPDHPRSRAERCESTAPDVTASPDDLAIILDGEAADLGASYVGTDPKIKALQEQNNEMDAAIKRARRLLHRMKAEYKLIEYCTTKAEAGIESIMEEFEPPAFRTEEELDALGDDFDLDDENDSALRAGQQAVEPNALGNRRHSSGTLASGRRRSSVGAALGAGPPRRVSLVGQAKASAPDGGAKDRRTSLFEKPGGGHGQHEAVELPKVDPQELERAETKVKQQIADLQLSTAKDVARTKAEKARAKALKRDIANLRRRYKALTENDKTAPTSLDGLQKQIAYYEETETRIRAQIVELSEELATQNRMLGKAQAGQKERDDRRDRAPAATSANPSDAAARLDEWPSRTAGQKPDGSFGALGANAPATPPTSPRADGAGAVEPNSLSPLSSPPALPTLAPSSAPQSATPPPLPTPSSPSPLACSAAAAVAELRPTRALVPAVPANSTGEALEKRLSSRSSTAALARVPESPKAKAPTFSPQLNAAQDEMAELVRLEAQNDDLKAEIDDIVCKMQQLRKAMKKGKNVSLSTESMKKIVGIPLDAEEVKPPPEYFNIKKEVRQKQNEVRKLRKRWWVDHKDLEGVVEKVRRQAPASAVGAGDTPGARLGGLDGFFASGGEPSQATPFGTAERRVSQVVDFGGTWRPVGMEGDRRPLGGPLVPGGESLYHGHGAEPSCHVRSGLHPSRGQPHGPAARRAGGGELAPMMMVSAVAMGSRLYSDTQSPRSRFSVVQRSLRRSMVNTGEGRTLSDLFGDEEEAGAATEVGQFDRTRKTYDRSETSAVPPA